MTWWRAHQPSAMVAALGALAAALVATVMLAGCSAHGDAPTPAPATSTGPSPAQPSPAEPASPAQPSPPSHLNARPVGPDGMTIRYLDKDGKIKTLRVEDFPR